MSFPWSEVRTKRLTVQDGLDDIGYLNVTGILTFPNRVALTNIPLGTANQILRTNSAGNGTEYTSTIPASQVSGTMQVSQVPIGTANQIMRTNSSATSAEYTSTINLANIPVGTANQVLSTFSSATAWRTPPLWYNSGGGITPKIWVGTANTSAGVATFNITSAGFSSILAISADIVSSDAAANQAWANITASSTSSVSVSVYNTQSTGVVVLGITVVGSIATTLYTATPKSINLVVIGL